MDGNLCRCTQLSPYDTCDRLRPHHDPGSNENEQTLLTQQETQEDLYDRKGDDAIP